ncbi:MAG: twin-arginine translocase TatA/TatE family subunit [Verrucomicrobia subdivision 3 bacterium]|nr:twin-arginine translocase TatA/TatE family subunit [Limisphaerales bacterium]
MLAFIQGSEWLIIGLAVLLLFGAKKLPELARGLGKGIREFKKASSDIGDELNRSDHEDDHDRSRRRQRPIEDHQEKTAQAEVEEDKPGKATSESN